MNEKITSYEIKEALSKKHKGEFFLTEVKNGPSGVAAGKLLRFDAVAIYKSWTNQKIRGYEIKISRGDFLRDAKYSQYLQYFNEFYFIVPTGMVQRQEVEGDTGLMWYNPGTGSITTKKKAVYKKIAPDPDFLLYIIMYRLYSHKAPFMLQKEEVFRSWLKEKKSNKELAKHVKSKLLKDNATLEQEVERLKGLEEAEKKLYSLMAVMAKHNIINYIKLERELDEALTTGYPPELNAIKKDIERVAAEIEELKHKHTLK